MFMHSLVKQCYLFLSPLGIFMIFCFYHLTLRTLTTCSLFFLFDFLENEYFDCILKVLVTANCVFMFLLLFIAACLIFVLLSSFLYTL